MRPFGLVQQSPFINVKRVGLLELARPIGLRLGKLGHICSLFLSVNVKKTALNTLLRKNTTLSHMRVLEVHVHKTT